ncbi:MAG: LacI family DNA-binding transcriptional regulator [Clostridia bacterium]|nr:LacI family DNA-binding transcriptional regulator [Clostridia bacterium]
MTLAKLAELTGTSVSTVSKAFSGSKEISEPTREHIFALAKEIGCFDKYYKPPRNRPLIALMTPEPDSEYYARMVGLLERAINARGADTIIAFTRFDPEQEARLFRELAYGLKVDGVVLWGTGSQIRNPDALPLVTVTGIRALPQNADAVRIDFDGGMLALAATLKEYGHKNVGFIGENLTAATEGRLKDALRRVGLPVHGRYFALSSRRFTEAGEDGMRELIARGDLPDVIVAAYDHIAYGAMKYAQERGYRIPRDISFIGIDDTSPTPYLDIPLSSLHVEFEAACAPITDLLFKRIENKYYREREEISVPVTLTVRESLRCAE